jgi:energy-coupling factor transporter ATP-binding protein EcfA2
LRICWSSDFLVITFRNVSLIYPNSLRTVLDGLSIEVKEGEMVLVIGHTGVGKSSLIKLVNGLIPHHTGGILSGEIEVAGRSTRSLKPGQLSDVVGIVGQNPANGFVADTVEDEIAFGLEAHGIAPEIMRKRVEEVLDLLSLTDLRERSLSTLSGGEQQRVAIGAALVLNPKVLLLDEPTSALDPIAAEEVLAIVYRLVHDLGLTVIIAEHRLERVIQFADRILLINEDGSAEIGETAAMLATSPIAPPLVKLAKVLGQEKVSLSVRELRRSTEELRNALANLTPKETLPAIGEEVFSVRNLSAKYGSDDVLSNVSLSIHTGEVVALMGRNGAGKSTLLKSSVGLSPITQGEVKVVGKDPRELHGKDLISRVGYIPQEPNDLLFNQSVSAECEQADRDNQIPPGSTLKIFQSLIAIPSLSMHPRDLSEGQRLALALSIVLSSKPHLLILDEPTRGLDYEAKRELIRIVRDLPCGIFIASHDVELVAEIADRVIFLADGEIVAQGSTREVLTASPAFAPQVTKALAPQAWLTVSEVMSALESHHA